MSGTFPAPQCLNQGRSSAGCRVHGAAWRPHALQLFPPLGGNSALIQNAVFSLGSATAVGRGSTKVLTRKVSLFTAGGRTAADTSCVTCVKRENGARVSGQARCGGSGSGSGPRSAPSADASCSARPRSARRRYTRCAVTSRGEASSVNSELIIHEADDTTPRRRSKQEAWLIKVKVVKLTEVKLFKLSK